MNEAISHITLIVKDLNKNGKVIKAYISGGRNLFERTKDLFVKS